jgi:type II secretory pathway pseudopilin PulG
MIEIMVSVVVLAIVIAPMFDAFVRGRVMVAHRGEERVALRLIERKVEQLLQAGGAASGTDTDITSTNMTAGTHPTNSAITLITRGDLDTSNDVIGDLTWDVTSVTWTDAAGTWDDATYKRVVTKLAWPQGAHRDSVSIITIIN